MVFIIVITQIIKKNMGENKLSRMKSKSMIHIIYALIDRE